MRTRRVGGTAWTGIHGSFIGLASNRTTATVTRTQDRPKVKETFDNKQKIQILVLNLRQQIIKTKGKVKLAKLLRQLHQAEEALKVLDRRLLKCRNRGSGDRAERDHVKS